MVRIVSTASLPGVTGLDLYDTHADGFSFDLPDRRRKAKTQPQTSKTVSKTTSKTQTRVKSAKVELNAKDMPLD